MRELAGGGCVALVVSVGDRYIYIFLIYINIFFCIGWTIRTYCKIQCLRYEGFSLNRPHWADTVLELPCPSVCGWFCGSVTSGEVFCRPLIGPEVT